MTKGVTLPLGSLSKDNRGITYVKVGQPNIWRRYHHVIWEEAHGPIPASHVIRFVDGDTNNLRLDNLAMVSKKELYASVNQRHNECRKKPVGTEMVKKDKYVLVKMNDKKPRIWRLKHHLIWEEAHGPIPDGYLVSFADGDKSNFNLDNLVLITKSEQGRALGQYITRPIGTEYIEKDGRIRIKVSDNVWRDKQRLIWEDAHGKIPEGHNVFFVDGDKSNFRLDNLILISNRERCILLKNDRIKLKGDLLKAAINMAKLSVAFVDKKKIRKKV